MQGAEPTVCHLDFSWRKPAFVPEVRGWGQAGAWEGQGGAAAREGTCLHPRPHAPRTPGRGTSDFSGRQGRTALSRAATTAKLWQPRDLPRRPRPGLTYRSPPPPSAAAPWPETLTGTAAAETGADTDREPRPAARPRPQTLGLRGHAPATPPSRCAAPRVPPSPKRAAHPPTQRPGHALSLATPLGSRTPTQPRPRVFQSPASKSCLRPGTLLAAPPSATASGSSSSPSLGEDTWSPFGPAPGIAPPCPAPGFPPPPA